MIEYEKAYRQGEILFFKVKKKPNLPTYLKAHVKKDGVIREGEKEGHEHKVADTKTAQLTMFGDDPKEATTGVLDVLKKSARIEHPEHKPIDLPKGEYVVKVQKEATGKNTTQSVKD